MNFKVGDYVKGFNTKICEIIGFNSENWPIVILCGEEAALNPEFATLCLPEKWAINTDRKEFFDWFGEFANSSDEFIGPGGFTLFPARTDQDGERFHCGWTAPSDEYITKTFEYWCRVHRPDLLSCSVIPTNSIPEKWCVRRTPENSEVLNAWANQAHKDKLTKDDGFVCYNGNISAFLAFPEITYEQWKTIPEVSEWLNYSEVAKNVFVGVHMTPAFGFYCAYSHHAANEKSEIPINPEYPNCKGCENPFNPENEPEKRIYKDRCLNCQEIRKIVGYKPAKEFSSSSLNEIYSFNISMYESGKGSLFDKEIFEILIEYGVYVPVYEEEKLTPERFKEKWIFRLVTSGAQDGITANEFEADIKKLLKDK